MLYILPQSLVYRCWRIASCSSHYMPDNSSQTTAISTNDPTILSLLIDAVARNCQRRHRHLTEGEQELSRRLGDTHRRLVTKQFVFIGTPSGLSEGSVNWNET